MFWDCGAIVGIQVDALSLARTSLSGHTVSEQLLWGGARLDMRDDLLKSTPLAWACRWGRVEIVKVFPARGADPVEADAEPWARPRAWAERMQRTEIVELLDSKRTT